MQTTNSNVIVHAVFGTRGGDARMDAVVCESLYPFIKTILTNQECPPIEVGGAPDHVHFLFRLSEGLTIGEIVAEVKGGTLPLLRMLLHSFSWQDEFGAFSVSPKDVETTVSYIRNQQEIHPKMSFYDEFKALMTESGLVRDSDLAWHYAD